MPVKLSQTFVTNSPINLEKVCSVTFLLLLVFLRESRTEILPCVFFSWKFDLELGHFMSFPIISFVAHVVLLPCKD